MVRMILATLCESSVLERASRRGGGERTFCTCATLLIKRGTLLNRHIRQINLPLVAHVRVHYRRTRITVMLKIHGDGSRHDTVDDNPLRVKWIIA